MIFLTIITFHGIENQHFIKIQLFSKNIETYFWAYRINTRDIRKKTMLGSQTPTTGPRLSALVKVIVKRDRTINIAPSEIPIARCRPIPPRTFRLARAIPMRVNTKIDTGSEDRRYSSVSKIRVPPMPLFFC